MSEGEDRPKLRPNRFNKFEKSNFVKNNNLSPSPETSRHPHKRIASSTPSYSQGKRTCYGLMHPPSSTKNLAQNRLQKLKQSLQADLQKYKESEPITSDNKDIEKPYINMNEASRSIYKNLSKWATSSEDTDKGNSANNRFKRLQKMIKETGNNEIPKFSDSSGTPTTSYSAFSPTRNFTKTSNSPVMSSKIMQIPTSTPSPIPLSETPSPEVNHQSPLHRDKVKCKRKFADSFLAVDEYCGAKKLFNNAPGVSETSPNVRKTIVDKIKNVPSLANSTRLSSRILKIKHKTEEINNSLNSSSLSPISEKFYREESHRSPLVTTPLSEQSNIWHSESDKSDSKTPDIFNVPVRESQGLKCNSKDRFRSEQYYSASELSNKSPLNRLSSNDQEVQDTSTKKSLSKTLKPSAASYLSKRIKSLHNESGDCESKNSVEEYDQFNKTNLDSRLKVTTTVVISPQNRLNKFKIISVDKPKTHTKTTPSDQKKSLEDNFNSKSVSRNQSTLPPQVVHKNKDINSVNIFKNQDLSNLKVPSGNLTQETLSNLHIPSTDASDNFDEKMAMTASWIKHHQQYAQQYKSIKAASDEIKTVVKVNEEESNKNLEGNKAHYVPDDSEEMEWSNAEPDTDTQEPKTNSISEEPQKSLQITKMTKETKDKRLCIVVDTNIFISELSKISDIINLKVTGPVEPLIYIPWMVITELDEMKDRPGSNSLKSKAMNAIRCINKLLSEENPRVKGQSICDMGNQKNVGVSQDDKIIGTCLQAAEQYERVILLSSDINLKNKAMINGISVSSANEIIMKIMSKLDKDTKYKKINLKMSMLCSTIICDCAKEAYGDVWMRMDMLSNPPWSFVECLKRFRKYWVAVFDEKLMKQFLTTVERLESLLATNKYFCDDSNEYNEFVKLSLNLCIFLKDIEEYRGATERALNDIIKIG